jgi:hypothetical protein
MGLEYHPAENLAKRVHIQATKGKGTNRSLAPWSNPTICRVKLLIGALCLLVVQVQAGKPHKNCDAPPLLHCLSKNHKRREPTMCRAHSHNDYHQADPLSSALNHGLKSVEVDVFPRQDRLWVAHTVFELNPEKMIDNLYIEPILNLYRQRKEPRSDGDKEKERFEAMLARSNPLVVSRQFQAPKKMNKYPRGGSDCRIQSQLKATRNQVPIPKVDNLNLLVDFKGDAEKSTLLLKRALTPLHPFLSKIDRNGVFRPGRLTVLISGNRPSVSSLQATNGERYLFLDGRVNDVHANVRTDLVPLISLPWRHVRLARAVGLGERYMQRLTERAHAQGKLVRIWGAPNTVDAWTTQVRGNIDLLSIDDHVKFAQFVAANKKREI